MIKIIEESCCILCGRTSGNFNGQVCDDNHCDSTYYNPYYENGEFKKGKELLSREFIEESKNIIGKRYKEINKTIEDHSKDYAKLEFDMLIRLYNYLYKKDFTLWQLKSIKDRLEHFEYAWRFELKTLNNVKYCRHCGAELKK